MHLMQPIHKIYVYNKYCVVCHKTLNLVKCVIIVFNTYLDKGRKFSYRNNFCTYRRNGKNDSVVFSLAAYSPVYLVDLLVQSLKNEYSMWYDMLDMKYVVPTMIANKHCNNKSNYIISRNNI